MEQQRLDQTADEENRILRENLEQVADILEPVLGQQAAAANAATAAAAAAAAPAANVGGVNPQNAGREAINVNLEGVQAALNIQQERVNRAEEARRNPAASGRSSTLEESLLGPFMNIQRVLGRLNNPATRDDPAVQARNVASLERVTAETVERGFGRSLHPFTVQQDQRTARMVGQLTGEWREKSWS